VAREIRLKSCTDILRQPTAEAVYREPGELDLTAADPAVLGELREFVRIAWSRWKEAARGEPAESAVAYIVSPWGYGKTFYGLVLRRLAEERGFRALYITFDDIEEYLSEAMRPDDTAQRLAAQLARHFYERASAETGDPVIVIIDEVETMVKTGSALTDKERRVIDAFITLYQSLVNPRIGAEAPGRLRAYQGRLHLALLLTPAANIRLLGVLEEFMKSGKILRRYDKFIRIRPPAKPQAYRIASSYLEKHIGIGLEELLDNPAFFNTLYHVTSGIPGPLLDLVRQLATISERQCKQETVKCCIVPYGAKSLLEALNKIELPATEGDRYKPLTELAYTIAPEMPEHLLEKLLAFQPLTREEAAELGSYGIITRKTIIYGGLQERDVASWIDTLSNALCRGASEDCRSETRRAAQYLVRLEPNGKTYAIVLPASTQELIEWLTDLGWLGGLHAPENLAPTPPKPKGEARPGYIIPPGAARKLFSTPEYIGLEFIIEQRVRRDVANKIEDMLKQEEKISIYISKGLEEALRITHEQDTQGSWPIKYDNTLYYEFLHNNRLYKVPIDITDSIENAGETSIILFTGKTENIKNGELQKRVITVDLPEGDKRFLLALHAAIEYHGEDTIDKHMVAERARRIATTLDLANKLRKISLNMINLGIIIEPRTYEEYLTTHGSPRDKFNLLKDTLSYLIALGGYEQPRRTHDITQLIWNLVQITPYSEKGKKWCGMKVEPVGRYSDIKDPESRERLNHLIQTSLIILQEENLIEQEIIQNKIFYIFNKNEILLKRLNK